MPTAAAPDDEPVPKLPRGRGMKFSGPELFRIAVTLAILVAVVVLTKPCASAVSTFVMGMDGSGSAKGSAMPKPGTVDVDPYEHLKPGMTDEEIKQAMERAKAKGPVPLPQGPGVGSAGSATLPPPPIPPNGSAAKPPTPTNGSAAMTPRSAGSAAIAPVPMQTVP